MNNTVLEGRSNYIPTVDATKLCFKEATSFRLLSEEEEKECFQQYSYSLMAKTFLGRVILHPFSLVVKE